jgi:fatty acid desaturase
VALAIGATAVVLALVITVDLLRPEDARTHHGRFVTGIGDDDGTFFTTIQRKWSTNVRLFGRTIWTWMVPIAAAFAVYVLVIARGWRSLLPAGSALRAGVVGTLFAGIIGWLVNDSGVVVSALVFVYLGPYLTLLAVDRDRVPALVAGDPQPVGESEPVAATVS